MKGKNKCGRSWSANVLILLIPMLLTACGTGISSCETTLVQYTKEENKSAAAFLELLPKENIIIRYMDDYAKLRCKIRGDCHGN